MNGAPKISVIIPVCGAAPYLVRCLHSVLALDYPHFEIIVIDDGLEQGAKNQLAHYGDKVRILESSGRGPSYARNYAARQTDAAYLAFCDADCIVKTNWLNLLLEGFRMVAPAASCGGIQDIPSDAIRFQKQVFRFMKKVRFVTDYIRKPSQQNIIEVAHNASCNVMYRRDIFLQEKGFREDLWPGEDVELDYRLRKKGYRLFCHPAAVVYHYRPQTVTAFLQMMSRYGQAQGFLVRHYGLFRVIHLVPFAGMAAGAIVLISALFGFLGLCLFVVVACLFGLWLYCGFDVFVLTLTVLGVLFWNVGFFKKFITGTSIRPITKIAP